MNLQNLNSQELEQLQMLLNKLNPLDNSPVLKLTPVEKMISDIMENFEWSRTQVAMENMNWKWKGEHVTVEMLKSEARRLLLHAADSRLSIHCNEHWELGIMCGTGGLEATAYCNEDKTKITALDLKFVLSQWDESIEAYECE